MSEFMNQLNRLNDRQQYKLLFGFTLMWLTVLAANALGQESNSVPVTPLPGRADPNIFYAMYEQVLNNPSSLLVIAFIGVLAWLADDLPFIPSRYVKHVCVIVGMSIYWLFTSESTVPKSFPHPQAVFIVNGTICGFVAWIGHRQGVARLISFVQGRAEAAKNEPQKTN